MQTTAGDDWPRVAHLLRPAQGGMRSQVRALLLAAPPVARLLAAPGDVLGALAADVSDRHAIDVAGNAPPALVQAGRAAGRWAKESGAALLHGHGLRWAPLFWSASLASGLPLVVTLHNLVPDDLSPPVRAAIQLALGRARRVIAVSRAVAESASRIAPAERIAVVYNGVDAGPYGGSAVAARREETRAALGLAEGQSLALCVARLSAEKGVGTFLEAAALAARAVPEACFAVAGDGPQRERLRWQASLLGLDADRVFLGARDDVPDLLAAADLVCAPSREEGLGLSAVEAMAAGRAVVASCVGGLLEVVDDGVTGLLVPPGDPAGFAQTIAGLLNDPARRQAMGAAGRRRVEAHFTRAAMLAGTRTVYAATLAGR